ncbi:(-)-germacrene D synthase-like [Pyrus ussuriensis x Pyrus communis]|uniref:(-)-germacrene D synthase-like n=1 Tax=Pyrus ussuriensis x Pyrus communis TaxID=2448454 RepID=A0A5N5G4D4_9ROSA|nr:(-)-germacrene D synthase-like [Pyrus ussuriensis x Pyrus communis]
MSSVEVPLSQSSNPNDIFDVHRPKPSATFSPSIWGDHFLSYASLEVDAELEQHVQELKEEVRRMLMTSPENVSKKLNLIDDIQRLGVSYHFGNEIEEILQKIHESSYDLDDLCTAALRFRLLRQQGYNVSCDLFNKFKDGNGNFKESLVDDVVGLLSLYEATHLRIHGEEILDEALNFTTTNLESATFRLSPPLAKAVTHALNQPLRKGLPRVEARYYLSVYQELRESPNETLLTFAKLDFNRLQRVHQWWKDLDVPNKLPFSRDRLVEVYFCFSMSVHFQPQYSFARRTSCKVAAIVSIIDDIYEYDTNEELKLFTEAIERWDVSAMDQLTEYMKVCYRALLDVYSEIQEKLAHDGKLHQIHHAREAMKKQVRGYFDEAKLFRQKHMPSLDEYMSVPLVTGGCLLLITTSFVGMAEATIDSFDWLLTSPPVVKATSTIIRLMDDIVEHKFEQEKEHFIGVVNCYMKKYGATEEEAITELQGQVNNAWKDINEACLHPTAVPMPLLIRFLNFARVMDVVYKHEDGYTNAKGVVKDLIISTLVEPVAL